MRYLKVKLFITTILILIVGLVITSFPPARAQRHPRPPADGQKLLEVVARREGLNATRLHVLKSTTVELPLTGRHVQVAKIINTENGQSFTASIDEQGQEVEFSTLKAEEQRAYRARYGKLEPKLHKKVEAVRADEKIKVAFWLNAMDDLDRNDPRDGRTDLNREEVDALLALRTEQVKAAASRTTEGLTRALERAGHVVDHRGEGAPMVFATLPAGLVKQFAERADVQVAYLAQDEQFGDHMNVAGPSIKADALWRDDVTGVGSSIAIIEEGRVDFRNSCLPNNLGTRVTTDPNIGNHATATAGIAASTNRRFRGIAPSAGIYSSNIINYGNSANIAAAMDAGSANADVSNNSWGYTHCGADGGGLNVWGRHADYIVRYRWDTVTASAGNLGLCTNPKGYVNSVGAAFNTIAVGNYDDLGTVQSADNVMYPTSSWEDPLSLHGDREKPEVAAPGSNITTTVMSPDFKCDTLEVGSGTSLSAPVVAGLAADLMQAKPTLVVFPESTKALIMAGAIDNVEGAASLSEKDGAGGVNALRSYTSAINNRYHWQNVIAQSFDANGDITIDMGWVNAGQRVKVALVWDSNPSFDYTSDPLNADLDLYVFGPNQGQASASYDNSYETVDFTATVSGNFQIKVHKFRFDGFNEYFAVAWSL